MGPLRSRHMALLGVAAICCLVGWLYLWPEKTLRISRLTFSYAEVPDGACDGDDADITSINSQPSVIPNTVHYVWLLQDPDELRLNFKAFVSIYSAHRYWSPERIYIHTDASPEIFQRARTDGDEWTRRVLSIPEVMPNFVKPPQYTRQGIEIEAMEHRSDFLRLSMLKQYGGVYLDMDAVPLQDIRALRHSGFANVVGGQTSLDPIYEGEINNGILMSVPNSKLMKIYHDASHEYFNGIWATASTHLLSDLARRLTSVPSEVLILHGSAFSPASFEFEDENRLFSPRFGNSSQAAEDTEQLNRAKNAAPSTCAETLAWLKTGPGKGYGHTHPGIKDHDAWDLDLSGTYILHAFDNEVGRIKGWDGKITLEYVLARRSWYARAVYPAMQHAIETGVIAGDELV